MISGLAEEVRLSWLWILDQIPASLTLHLTFGGGYILVFCLVIFLRKSTGGVFSIMW
jgi:hypothetical protein